jgi:5'-phosphate synthase pdxT subunit
MKRIGVLALQGAFAEHIAVLRRLGVEAVPMRLPSELEGIDGLVVPGGESTTMVKLMEEYGLTPKLRSAIAAGMPVLGTCAGLALMARTVHGDDPGSLGVMDIEVRRNAFGRQVDSFEIDLDVPALGRPLFRAIFIRAPWIEKVGANVEVLASLPDGTAVAARERNMVAAAFHPELTTDLRFHDYFLNIVDGNSGIDAVV